jgi:DNA-directed RNA polymerase subunit alpha
MAVDSKTSPERTLSVLIAQRPTLTEEVVTDRRSRFVLEPLEPGFGYTLGNSIRRTLLSSIPGAAVTSIRIDGVLHEFTTVPGVKEDVTDLILNLKEVVVSSESDEPVVMYLRKQGPGPVTAADIAPPAGVEVHNPELHIATLNGKGRLEIELTVERGRGYVSAVQNRSVASRSTPSTARCSRSPTRSRRPASSSAPTSTSSSSMSRPRTA